ncbi:hypothetical protein WJX72_011801 [[Myrmecia] bisecta]|uniref:non-specific serine/threonine protein kinase n=1 Tax=[Myrmecia] bisecta TaxID=41462 RepID=A0AAW1R8Y3_9CHLO
MADSLADREGNAGYKAPRAALSLGDFELVKRLGDGSYSQVVQARHKGSRKSYALKIVDKHLIQRHKMVAYIRNERHILDRLDHPGVVNLCFTFQDATSLYLGQELCPNGELYDQIQRRGRLQLEDTQFYTAEIVEILDYLQQCQVVHRDLKPENLMLDVNGHIKLIDFGSAKSLGDGEASEASPEGEARRSNSSESRRATSLVGTADYVAPETLSNQAITPAYDLWSLGCVVYQMLVGRPPFKDASEYLTFQRIAAADYTLPDDLPPVALDLIKQLLVLEPEKRLGVGLRGLDELREHAFFDSVHWEHIWETAAPAIAPPRNTSRELDEKGLDWEMQSLAAALPVVYHYEPTEEGAVEVQNSYLAGAEEAGSTSLI